MFNAIKQFLCKLFGRPRPSQNPQYRYGGTTSKSRSRRTNDLAAESQLAVFLDKYLYADFPTKASFSEIKRIYDKDEQLQGVDVEFRGTDGHIYYVDEKAQLYYLNQNLPTFAFEILFKRGYEDTIGWLCNPSLKTDLYMLIWPFASQDTCYGITWDRFTKLDCLLVSKDKILRMLANYGLTVDRMQQDAMNIRANGQTGKIPIHGLRGIYYYASNSSRYQEAPINIVVAKPLLMNIAQRRYIVTRDNIISE